MLLIKSFCTVGGEASSLMTAAGCGTIRAAAGAAAAAAGTISGAVTATGGRAGAAGNNTYGAAVGTIANVEGSGGGGTVIRCPVGIATTGGAAAAAGLPLASFTGTATVAATPGTAPPVTGVITGGGRAY